MDCSEFRRRLLIDPAAPELAVAANARVCADAPARLAEALAFEHQLERAIEVAVPSTLVEQVLQATAEEFGVRTKPRRWPYLALAASILVALALSFGVWRGAGSVTEQVILASVEHIAHEPYAMTRTERVPQPLLARMFGEAGLGVDESQLDISYLNRCPIGTHLSVHMVMPAASGPVTVIYLPGETGIERMDTRSSMVAVRTLPFAHGAMVLLAESNQDFDRIESAWHGAAGDAELVAGGL